MLGDARGVTATGAVLIALLIGAAGALADLLTGNGLRELFAVGFVTGCVAAAVTAHREDLVATVVMPPLLYVALVLGVGFVDRPPGGGSLLGSQVIALANALVMGAPVLGAATLAALIVAVVRSRR